MSQLSRLIPTSGPGSGTVTSITFNGGLTSTPDPITTTGTATIDQTNLTVLDGTVYWDTGTQLLHTTATGSAGDVLTSQGAGLPPVYAPAPGTTLTFDGDSASATPALNIINFKARSTSGSTVLFAASGNTVELDVTDVNANTLIGEGAGNLTLTGINNTGLGDGALAGLTNGGSNTGVGLDALADLQSGGSNTALGSLALDAILTGANNIGIGASAGSGYVTSESSNIVIGASGTTGESNVLRIGTNGSGAGQQNKCFVAGVDGVNVGSVATVVTEASNQLGTAVLTAGSGVTIVPGANTITIAATGSGGTVTSVSGGNNITITGTPTINPTVNVSGTTNHAVQIGNSTGSLTSLAVGATGTVLTGVTGSDPIWAAPATSGTVTTLHTQDGNNVTQTAGVINLSGGNSLTTTGTAGPNTATISLTGITQYNVQTGGASNALNNVAPGATSGVPLISQGASSQPIFGTVVVAGGGTGDTSFTAYAPICGGTTTTGALQVASTGLSTSGFVLTSNGSSALPSFVAAPGANAFNSITVQIFTSSGTYTPTSGMKYCTIEVVGGGGGGGGCANSAAFKTICSGGGGGGGYARKTVASATIGASQVVTVGTGGTAGANTGGTGGTGGTSSVGVIVVATGGIGGVGQTTSSSNGAGYIGAAGGAGTTGDILASGGPGSMGLGFNVASQFAMIVAGNGGNSIFGGGGLGATTNNTAVLTPVNGSVYGGGGSGTGNYNAAGASAGGVGGAGIVIVTEYIH